MMAINRRSFLGLGIGLGTGAVAAAGLKGASAWAVADAESNIIGSSPVVDTTAGKVRGLRTYHVNSYKGIPYGASTAGAGRFLPPAKPAAWTGVREAYELGLRSPQLQAHIVCEMGVMDRTEPMGEECLCLNVWSREPMSGGKRPVMVWLHGGGYSGGSDGFLQYDGSNLAAKHDVVVVGVNHRLNIFGFLYLADLGDERFAQASNVGMLDIVAALEWVRDNIANFGGDPSNVTIFGQSGGGGKVSTLLGMPAAKGLFHRAIAMSGSAVTGVPREKATEAAEAILAKVNLDKNRIADLQKLSMYQLLQLTAGQPGGGGPGGGGLGFQLAPVVDGRTIPANNFEPVATQISADVPLMIGSTETEITWNTNQFYDPLDDAELHSQLKRALRTSDDGAVDRVIAVYRKNRPQASNLDLFLIAGSDGSQFRIGTDTEAIRKAQLGRAAVYRYYFQWYSPVRGGMLRAMHTMDIPFVYDNVDIAVTEVGTGPERQALADRMSRAWVAFARSGDPNHPGLPHWPAFNDREKATMVFNDVCTMVNDPYGEEKAAIAAAMKTEHGDHRG